MKNEEYQGDRLAFRTYFIGLVNAELSQTVAGFNGPGAGENSWCASMSEDLLAQCARWAERMVEIERAREREDESEETPYD